MLNQDPNASMLSTDSVPVGFKSFSQDVFGADNPEQMKAMAEPAEISFAKDVELMDPPSPKQEEQMVLAEIQNRGSLGVDDAQDSPEKEKLESAVANRRDAKLQNKKSDLYMKIMRDHGLDGASTKLNYEIPALKPKTPVNELFSMVKNEEGQAKQQEIATTEKLTIAKPFDF